MSIFEQRKCELQWHYNQNIDVKKSSVLHGAKPTDADIEQFVEWQQESRAYSDKAEAQIKKLLVKLANGAPQLDYSESIADRNEVIANLQKEYVERKCLLDGEATEIQKLTTKLYLTGVINGSSVLNTLHTVSSYLELSQLKEIALEMNESGSTIELINQRIEDFIYPRYSGELAELTNARYKLIESQNELNRQLPIAIIKAKLS